MYLRKNTFPVTDASEVQKYTVRCQGRFTRHINSIKGKLFKAQAEELF